MVLEATDRSLEKKLSPEERAKVAEWSERIFEEGQPKFKQAQKEKELEPDTDKHPILFYGQLAETLGTARPELISHLLDQVGGVFQNSDPAGAANKAIAAVKGIGPKDVLESMLAVQMVGTHNAAMEMLRRSLLTKQTFEGTNAAVNRATKLLRTFAAQVETLNRYRGKTTQQHVTVEHVNVHQGGQAIVGAVTGGPGVGDNEKK